MEKNKCKAPGRIRTHIILIMRHLLHLCDSKTGSNEAELFFFQDGSSFSEPAAAKTFASAATSGAKTETKTATSGSEKRNFPCNQALELNGFGLKLEGLGLALCSALGSLSGSVLGSNLKIQYLS